MREIKKLIIHCSDSSFGDAATIDNWHKERGWDGIGYHYVVLNGFRKPGQNYNPIEDGLVEPGRPIEKMGAHCRGHNKKSIGVCLIGVRLFSAKQLYGALPKLIRRIGLGTIEEVEIVGHCELDGGKSCPNIDMNMLRNFLNNKEGLI